MKEGKEGKKRGNEERFIILNYVKRSGSEYLMARRSQIQKNNPKPNKNLPI